MDDPLDGQDRSEPSKSETSVDLDLQDDETAEKLEKRQNGDVTVEDIENEDLRKKVKAARERARERGDADTTPELNDNDAADKEDVEEAFQNDGSDSSDDEVGRVRVEEGENPLQAVADDAFGDGNDDEADGGVMDGVDDDDVQEAMDMELNVVEDIDPEHFNYEDQDFSSFSNYGQEATIEYNDAYFHLVQPSDRKQEQLINSMGGGLDDDGMSMTEMMESMINATVDRPSNIDEIVADWSPFERMGLGMQCMEFLGLDAMGNI